MKLKLLRFITLSVWLGLTGAAAFGQGVTTSQISGVATSKAGEALPGATIKAVHTPSGTVYGTISNDAGRFTMPGMRVGGPYTITVDYVGFQQFVQNDIYLQLGQTFIIDPKLNDEGVALSEVVIEGRQNPLLNSDRTGASTNISSSQVLELPAFNRSLTDLTRITPQAGNNSSFAGRQGRFSNITIDGALVNNVFGLNDNPLPGSSANTQPISLDAIEQVSVDIAPYDVSQSGFTSGGISAVTRSGTNEFSGSAYYFAQRGRWEPKRTGGVERNLPNTEINQYGLRIGGPIIKDKLFFFLNVEQEESELGLNLFRPRTGTESASAANLISNAQAEDIANLTNLLRQNFNSDFGGTSWDNVSSNDKIFARIDWNINQNHKLSARFSTTSAEGPVTNASNSDDGITINGNSRVNGINSIPFYSSTYRFITDITTASLELNSSFGSKAFNSLLITGTIINEEQKANGPDFPTVDIARSDVNFTTNSSNQITGVTLATTFGVDPFRGENSIKQNQFLVQNNFKYFLGKHTLTAGASFEYYDINNRFLRGRFGRYTFRSFASFEQHLQELNAGLPISDAAAPINYWVGYDLPGRSSDAALEAAQVGVYVQDEWNPMPNLRVTAGIRLDVPFYLTDVQENKEASQLFNAPIGSLPDAQYMVQPRVGVNWDVFGDRSLQVRGGTGIFNGRIPFVWMTNNVGLTGASSGSVIYRGTLVGGAITPARIDGENIRFSPTIPQPYINPSVGGGPAGSLPLAYAEDGFKWPQVWRSSIGADYSIGEGWIVTLDAAYTKDINAIFHRELNRGAVAPNSERFLGRSNNVTVPSISGSRDVNTTAPYNREVTGLVNVNEGYSWFVTGQLQRDFNDGFAASVAYTYTDAEAVTNNPSSSAFSAIQFNPIVGDINRPQMMPSESAVRHRVVGNLTKTFTYSKYTSTTVSVFYQIQTGPRYSYVFNGDLNGDGLNANDLLYVPADANDMIFIFPGGGSEGTGTGTRPTGDNRNLAQMRSQWNAFVAQDPYLNRNRGRFTERSGASLPMVGIMDLRVLQRFFVNVKGKRNELQFSLEVINFGNLLNDQWGVFRRTTITNPLQILDLNGTDATTGRTGLPRVYFPLQDPANGVPFTRTFDIDPNSRYRIQCGIRYNFN